jgi:MFS family permease
MTNSGTIQEKRLFLASCLALIVTAMSFSIRAGILSQLGTEFSLSDADLGWINSMAFLGFPVAMLIGGPLCDLVGMGRLLVLAFVAHLLGISLTISAGGFWSLFISTFFIGFANGMVEAACNPLITVLFPEAKTKMLNRFHMWFPGGLLIGGLVSYSFGLLQFGWQWQLSLMLLPCLAYGFLFLGMQFPKTRQAEENIPVSAMLKACLSPFYLLLIFCMFLTATTELGTNQWISKILQNTTSNSLLLIVFISGIMAIGRYFAGPVEKIFGPFRMLMISSLLAMLGLFWLSYAEGYAAFGAASVFAAGVTFFWPTMMGVTAEFVPQSGSLGMAFMGGAGMFATSIFNPLLGKFLDEGKAAAMASGLDEAGADLLAGQTALAYMSAFPAILLLIFVFMSSKMPAKAPVNQEDFRKLDS